MALFKGLRSLIMADNHKFKTAQAAKKRFLHSWPLLAEDPLWRPKFPVIRPLEGEIQELRDENDRLKKELARQRAASVRATLAWENERLQRSHLEEAFFAGYHDFAGWFNTAAFPMTCVGDDGIIDQANVQQLVILRYSREEYIGHPMGEFLPDHDVTQAILDAMRGGELFKNRQTSMRCKDGGLKPVMISCEPFNQGVSHGICCYVQDLSEVLRCRSGQEESERLFRELADNIREVFWMTSPEKREMLYVSPAYETVWGQSRQSLYDNPTSFLDGIHEEDRARVKQALPLQSQEDGYLQDYRVVRPDGAVRWVRDRAFPVRDERGDVFRIAGLAEDITEIKQAEEELRSRGLQQEALAELGHTALTEMSLQKLFDRAVERLGETLDVEFTKVLQCDPEKKNLLLRSGRGWKAGLVGVATVPAGRDSQAGFTLECQEPVIVENLEKEDRFSAPLLLRGHGVVSGMSVVIAGRQTPFGVLGAHTRRPRRFTRQDVNFFQAVAHILAAAVERRAAEEAQKDLSVQLAIQRKRLDDILINLPAIVWELRLDPEMNSLRLTYASDYAKIMVGYSKEELVETPGLWQERIHPEDQEKVDREIKEILAGGRPEPVQFRWIARDGHLVWLHSTKQLFRDEAGNPLGLRGVILDITEQKLEEAKREVAEERFHDMLKNLPAVVWESRVDPVSGQISPVFVSDYVERLMGFPKEEWTRNLNLWVDRVHPEDRESVQRVAKGVFLNEEQGTEQFRWIARDGRTVWIQSSKRIVRDRAGRAVGLRGVNIDVSDRKLAEKERQVAEENFRDTLANVPGAVWEMRLEPETENLRLVFVSDYAETMSGGYTKEDFLRVRNFCLDRLHPDDREMVRDSIKGVLHGKTPGSYLARWIGKDEKMIWIETRQRVVTDRDGKPIGLRGVTVDVTARKRAEAEREAVEERFHAFMDNSPVAAVMKDEEGRYIYGNRPFQAWCDKLGLEWQGLKDEEIFPEELARRYREKDREALEKNSVMQTLEVIYNSDETPHYWSILRFPVPSASGSRFLGTVAIDVTERRTLEREILEISDREQQRLGQELHDGLCQHLLGVALMSRTLADRMDKSGVQQAKEVRTITDFLYEALGLARGLMKGFHLVHVEARGGLAMALEEFTNTTGKLFGKRCTFESDVQFEVLDSDVGTHLFRIAQEATHNAIKHGNPTEVAVSLHRVGDDLLLTVENDGLPLPDLTSTQQGMGVRTMRYRADLIGATLSFQNRTAGGVIVSCQIPAGRAIKFVEN